MTRIFDALRKAQSGQRSEPAPPAPLPAHPLHPTHPPVPHAGAPTSAAVPLRAPTLRPILIPFSAEAPLAEDTVREMSSLRVNLVSTLGARPRQTILFVSPQGGEGASTVTSQFAQSLARDSRARILLVDAHLARPAFPEDRIASLAAAREAGSATLTNVHVLPFARQAAREAWSPDLLRDAIEACGQSYDWVLIDGPPVLESPELATMAANWDGVVLVVRAGRTKRPVLARSVDLLRRAGARVLGTVLNGRRLEIPGFIYRRI